MKKKYVVEGKVVEAESIDQAIQLALHGEVKVEEKKRATKEVKK